MTYNILPSANRKNSFFITAIAILLVSLATLTFIRNKDYETVEALWASAIRIDPQNPRAYLALGMVAMESGKSTKAERFFLRSIKLSHNGRDTRLDSLTNLGNIYAERGEPERALRQFEEILKIDPNHPQSLYNASLIRLRSSNPGSDPDEQTMYYYRRLENVLPDDHPRMTALQAIVLLKTDGPLAAVNILKRTGRNTIDDRALEDAWEEVLIASFHQDYMNDRTVFSVIQGVPDTEVLIRAIHRLAKAGNHIAGRRLTKASSRVRGDLHRAILNDPVAASFMN